MIKNIEITMNGNLYNGDDTQLALSKQPKVGLVTDWYGGEYLEVDLEEDETTEYDVLVSINDIAKLSDEELNWKTQYTKLKLEYERLSQAYNELCRLIMTEDL